MRKLEYIGILQVDDKIPILQGDIVQGHTTLAYSRAVIQMPGNTTESINYCILNISSAVRFSHFVAENAAFVFLVKGWKMTCNYLIILLL